MAHEIEFLDGRAQVLGRELWWHQLNEPLGRNATWEDVERLVPALTLEVEKVPISDLLDHNEGFRVHDDEYALVRVDGQILRTGIGERYEVVQASDFYEWGRNVVDIFDQHGEDADLVSAVSIRGGRQYAFVFEQAEVDILGVKYKGYFNLLGSHDMSMTNSLRVTPVITVCANTYHMNMGHTAAFIFRHTLNVDERMSQALTMLRATKDAKAGFEAVITDLVQKPLTTREFDLFVDSLFPTQDVAARTLTEHERAHEAVRALFAAPLNGGHERSAWAFVQAVNSYEQWNNPIRKVRRLGTKSSRAIRQFDAIAKRSQPLTDKALELVSAA